VLAGSEVVVVVARVVGACEDAPATAENGTTKTMAATTSEMSVISTARLGDSGNSDRRCLVLKAVITTRFRALAFDATSDCPRSLSFAQGPMPAKFIAGESFESETR